MESAEDLVELGRQARNDGRTEEALGFYERAGVAFEGEGKLARAAHSRRHRADLELKLGRLGDARRSIDEVIAFYRAHVPDALEMGNTLRIAALVEMAAGRSGKSRALWTRTLALYEEAGIAAGVEECRQELAS